MRTLGLDGHWYDDTGDRLVWLDCRWCGSRFTRPASRPGRRPSYCKPSCRQRAYEARYWTRRATEVTLPRPRYPWEALADG